MLRADFSKYGMKFHTVFPAHGDGENSLSHTQNKRRPNPNAKKPAEPQRQGNIQFSSSPPQFPLCSPTSIPRLRTR